MGRADYLREGDFNRICDRCGFKFKASDTIKEWQGLIVCHSCYESRHPLDFVRGRRDRQRVPWSRPEPENIFILEVYADDNSSIYADDAGNSYTDGNN
jgi:hypothetical protein